MNLYELEKSETQYFGATLEEFKNMIGKKFIYKKEIVEILELIKTGTLLDDNLTAYFLCCNLATKEDEQWIPEDIIILVKKGVILWLKNI